MGSLKNKAKTKTKHAAYDLFTNENKHIISILDRKGRKVKESGEGMVIKPSYCINPVDPIHNPAYVNSAPGVVQCCGPGHIHPISEHND